MDHFCFSGIVLFLFLGESLSDNVEDSICLGGLIALAILFTLLGKYFDFKNLD